jgi:hypothetical protein
VVLQGKRGYVTIEKPVMATEHIHPPYETLLVQDVEPCNDGNQLLFTEQTNLVKNEAPAEARELFERTGVLYTEVRRTRTVGGITTTKCIYASHGTVLFSALQSIIWLDDAVV